MSRAKFRADPLKNVAVYKEQTTDTDTQTLSILHYVKYEVYLLSLGRKPRACNRKYNSITKKRKVLLHNIKAITFCDHKVFTFSLFGSTLSQSSRVDNTEVVYQ